MERYDILRQVDRFRGVFITDARNGGLLQQLFEATARPNLFARLGKIITKAFQRQDEKAIPAASTARPVLDAPTADIRSHNSEIDTTTESITAPCATPKPSRYGVGDLIEGFFRVESVLRGGMGTVYICRQLQYAEVPRWAQIPPDPEQKVDAAPQARHAALKSFATELFWHSDVVDRFKREVFLWISLLPHPNVVRAQTFGNWLLHLEYVDGGNLRSRLAGKPLEEAEVLRISMQFCAGMCFLFESAGIIHRDIKPENMLFTRDGTVKITDFGLAKVFSLPVTENREASRKGPSDAPSTRTLTQYGAVLGTLPYMSPEQYEVSHEVAVTSDVYSFGVVLFEMLTGCLPFTATNFIEWRRKHTHEKPTPPSSFGDVNQALGTIVMKCLEKSPDHRFRDFAELRAELESYCNSTGRSELVPGSVSISELESRMTYHDWHGRGYALGQLGDNENSYKCYLRAHQLDPLGPGANTNIGTALLRLGRHEEALHYYEREVEVHPDMALAYDGLAMACLGVASRSQEALTAIRKAAKLAPDNFPVLRHYAFVSSRIGALKDYREATTAITNLLATPQFNKASSIVNEAVQFGRAGDLNMALALHVVSLKKFPEHAFCWYNAGVTLHRLGKSDEALAYYSTTIDRDKQWTLAWINRGLIHAQRGEYEKAERDWRSAIAIDSGHAASGAVELLMRVGRGAEFTRLLGELAKLTLRYFF